MSDLTGRRRPHLTANHRPDRTGPRRRTRIWRGGLIAILVASALSFVGAAPASAGRCDSSDDRGSVQCSFVRRCKRAGGSTEACEATVFRTGGSRNSEGGRESGRGGAGGFAGMSTDEMIDYGEGMIDGLDGNPPDRDRSRSYDDGYRDGANRSPSGRDA